MAYPSQGHEILILFDAHTRSFAALGGVANRWAAVGFGGG